MSVPTSQVPSPNSRRRGRRGDGRRDRSRRSNRRQERREHAVGERRPDDRPVRPHAVAVGRRVVRRAGDVGGLGLRAELGGDVVDGHGGEGQPEQCSGDHGGVSRLVLSVGSRSAPSRPTGERWLLGGVGVELGCYLRPMSVTTYLQNDMIRSDDVLRTGCHRRTAGEPTDGMMLGHMPCKLFTTNLCLHAPRK